MPAFVLVHSPLVGPLTWAPVARELTDKGLSAVAPALPDSRHLAPPYWKHHAAAGARALKAIPPGEPVVLVGHSGGGMLLPAVRQETKRPVAAYIYVDAGIPRNGLSRLDTFEDAEAKEFRAAAKDGLLPTWTETDLAGAIPDPDIRRRFVRELRPLPLAVYEEPLPVFAGWPDAPCGYLQLSPTYEPAAEEAREMGWAYRRLEGGHFHMLVEPAAVADALLGLVGDLGLGAAK
jgi:pimeloyl-ACP methyl ester carboxylesterase